MTKRIFFWWGVKYIVRTLGFKCEFNFRGVFIGYAKIAPPHNIPKNENQNFISNLPENKPHYCKNQNFTVDKET